MTYLFRSPSVGEFIGTTQAKRRISRRAHVHALDPFYQRELAVRRFKRRVGWYSFPMRLLRFLLRLSK